MIPTKNSWRLLRDGIYKIAVLLLVFSSLNGASQEIRKKAEAYVSRLCAPDFYGRGYTHQADKLAAAYIKKKFEVFGVKPLTDKGYYQNYKLGVNTFSDSVVVVLDQRKLETGIDFIVDPNSGSESGVFKPVYIGAEQILNKDWIGSQLRKWQSENAIAILDFKTSYSSDTSMRFREMFMALPEFVPTVLLSNEKLTWSVGREQWNHGAIRAVDSLWNREAAEIRLNIQSKFIKDYESQNVLGMVEATSRKGRKKYKYITAHYDHLGTMGNEAYIPGANDNASGTAMLLMLAEYYANNPPKDFSVVFIAFGSEEAGLLGSKHYVENPLLPLNKIEFLLNLDLLGTGEEGMTVVNATLHEKAFNTLLDINNKSDYLVKIKKRGPAANSDHYFFTKADVPAFFIYTMGGISAYHDVNDKAETLPLTEFEDLYNLIIRFMCEV